MRHTLSPHYDALYQQHLLTFQQRLRDTYGQQHYYTDFYPSIGVPRDKPVDLLVYGQAVGGWLPELDYRQPIPEGRVNESRDYSNDPANPHTPLDWVNLMWSKYVADEHADRRKAHVERYGAYTPSRSFFWLVTTYFMQQRFALAPNDWSWAERVAWSNLYKIAPQQGDKHPNPSEEDCVLQRPECVRLVELELRELQPAYCLVLTNDEWWAHFRTGLGTKELERPREGPVQSVEQFGNTRIVVTKRPYVGRYKEHVQRILEFLY
ncbi:MAG: hypothetical protein H6592_06200 [Flavobacteriales bacterium]|nr:hypothetical protein [Flavobacteriales bacterium]